MLDDFKSYLEQEERSGNTIKAYMQDIAAFQIWYEANIDLFSLNNITSIDLQEYKRYLEKQKLKPKSINRKLASLGTLSSWASQTGIIQHPVKLPKFIKAVNIEPKWLSNKEQNSLRRTIDKHASIRDKAIILLLMNSGLRICELCDLLWSNIKISQRKGELVVKGKGCKYRTVPLNPEARSALQDLGYDDFKDQDITVIHNKHNHAITTRSIQYVISKYGKLAKLDSLAPHQLRHTFCKNLANAGVSIEIIARLAGHNSLESTKIYIEPGKEELQAAVDTIGLEN